jgi:hypothetical protein
MYKLLGRRELKIERQGDASFSILLGGEFDQPPEGSPFPARQVHVILEARDPSLSPEIVEYKGPFTPDEVFSFALTPNSQGDVYSGVMDIPTDKWQSAQSLNGSPSNAVLSVLEYEIFPAAPSQVMRVEEDLIMHKDMRCWRRLVYSSSVQLTPPKGIS